MKNRFHFRPWPQFVSGLLLSVLVGCGGGKADPPARDQTTRTAAPKESRDKAASEPSQPATRPSNPSTTSNQEPPAQRLPGIPTTAATPEPIFRPDDEHPTHDDRKLAELGIRHFESTRLKLYTDIDPEVAATLPPLIDQAYLALVDYFGPLPPNRARTEFHMTGYLIKDEALFREAGLIPGDLPPFEHGRHRRNEFWMREQKYAYYRRHLLIHEVTHCFMTVMPDTDAPVWYMEGMAECFGTHRTDADGRTTFHVMPTSPEEFAGSGRITAVRTEFAEGRARSIPDILDLQPIEFLKTEQYAWAWALCTFLDTHPRYQKRFRHLRGYLQRNAFPTEFFRAFQPDARDLATEWTLYIQNLQYGYDTTRAAITFQPGMQLDDAETMRRADIQSDRGWQSSGVQVREGERYDIAATGQFELAKLPKPWISEAQGISFRYFNGRPLGELHGAIRTETGETGGAADSMLRSFPIGRAGTIQARFTGTLYLRLNDEWNSLADNQGAVSVEVRRHRP
jgi:hypothetical protein